MVTWFAGTKIFKHLCCHPLFVFLLGLLVVGCEPTTITRGNIPMAFQIERIDIGKTTSAEAIDILGSPTTRSASNENFWFYTGQTFREHPPWRTELIAQQVLVVHINDLDRVENLHRFQADPNGIITPFQQITTLTLRERTLIEQTLGFLFPGQF